MEDRRSSIGRHRSTVELKTWKRRQHYELFRKYRQPFFSLTVEVDVTTLWDRSRATAGPHFSSHRSISC
jgi:chloramphenicol O-acetyltransferase type A